MTHKKQSSLARNICQWGKETLTFAVKVSNGRNFLVFDILQGSSVDKKLIKTPFHIVVWCSKGAATITSEMIQGIKKIVQYAPNVKRLICFIEKENWIGDEIPEDVMKTYISVFKRLSPYLKNQAVIDFWGYSVGEKEDLKIICEVFVNRILLNVHKPQEHVHVSLDDIVIFKC